MSDTDICGAPTKADGSACQHPPTDEGTPGRCWEPAHNEDPSDQLNGAGRPSTFTDEIAREAVAAASEPISESGVARSIGVPRTTLQSWLNQNLQYTDEEGERHDFSAAFMRARRSPERLLVNGPLTRPDEVDGQHARFLLSTAFDYVKTEARELSGPGGGPIRTTEATEEEIDLLLEAFDTEPET
jgi:hypothetical protein